MLCTIFAIMNRMKHFKTSGQALIEYIILAWLIVSSLLLFFDLPKHIKNKLVARQSHVEQYLSQPIDDQTAESSTKSGGIKHAP